MTGIRSAADEAALHDTWLDGDEAVACRGCGWRVPIPREVNESLDLSR